MDPKNKTKPAPTAEDIRAAAVAEESRIQEVRNIAKDYPRNFRKRGQGWVGQNEDRNRRQRRNDQGAGGEIAANKLQQERPNMPNINAGTNPK